MNNWWLATLENFGLITRDQAVHIANEIKNSIHKEKYEEAFEDLKQILDRNKGLHSTLLTELEDKMYSLKDDVSTLKKELEALKSPQKPLAKEPKD